MADYESTGRVRVGRYELEVGAPPGTLIVARAGHDDPGALARALREQPARRAAIDRAEGAEEAAARAADGLELLTDILKGAVLEPQRAVQHVDLLLELTQRLDDEGRLADALRVARAVNGALALAMRWADLVRSLRTALHAAERLGDKSAIGWAHHELGTLHLAADDAAGAERDLAQARTIRKLLGDKEGLAATEHNLGYLCRQLCEMLHEDRPPGWRGRRALVFAAAVTLCFFIAGAVAAALVEKPHDKPELIAWVQGQGRVVSAPQGIACEGGRCEHGFPRGQRVTLTATARHGSRFVGWSGDCRGLAPCHLVLDRSKAVTAHFVPLPHTKTVHVHKQGDGRVTSATRAIDCGAVCTTHATPGTRVVLVARPGPHATFRGWGGPCTGTGPCRFTVHGADVTVDARFAGGSTPDSSTLTVRRTGTGAGTVTSTPAGIVCGRRCAISFQKGKQVILEAVAAAGSRFTGWGSPCSGTRPCTVTPRESLTVTANFEKTPTPDPRLTVNPAGEGSGSVISRAAGISCGQQCSATFPKGTVTLVAIPARDSVFAGWDGANCARESVCTVTLTEDTEVTATFQPAPPPRLTTSTTGLGSITPACSDGCPYDRGTPVTLTAAPAANHHVSGWSGCAQDASDPNRCEVTMTQDRDVSATFAADAEG